MTYWKVDLLNPALGVPKTHWFRNSHDAEQFYDRIPCSPYATSYYCREVRLPDQILDAARREALKRLNAIKAPPAPEEADPIAGVESCLLIPTRSHTTTFSFRKMNKFEDKTLSPVKNSETNNDVYKRSVLTNNSNSC